MSTFTASATQLAYVMRTTSSSWDFSGAVQGIYGGGNPRVGAMNFPTIRNVDWSRQIVNSIQLRLTFMAAGSNMGKTVYLYQGAKSSISGTGQSMIGTSMGSFSSNGNAYNATRTISFSSSSNASIFTNLVSWLTSGAATTLVIYRDEADGGDWSANYLKISAASITVDYYPAGSTGALSASSIMVGSSITLTITPPDGVSISSLSHTITWECGDASVTHTATGSDLTDTLTVPMSWVNEFPSAMSARATCTLTTRVNNEYRGSTTLAFTVVASQDLAPSIQASATVLDTTGGAYQYLSRILLQITNATAQNGATIVSYRITGTEGVSANASSYTTSKVQQPGTHTYTFSVTDSRGLTATMTQTVNVTAVHKPMISAFSVERYAEVVDDTVSYVPALYGDKVWVTAQVEFDSAGGNNTGEAWIRYNEVGSSAQTQVEIDVTNNEIDLSNDRTVLTNTISAQSAYEFELYVEDNTGSSGAFARVTKGFCSLYIDRTGYGVGVGAIVDNVSETNPLFRCGFPAEFNENVAIDGSLNTGGELIASGGIRGVTNYSTQEVNTGGTWVDGRPIYRKTFSLGAMSAGQSNNISIGLPSGSLDVVVSLRGMAQPDGGDYWLTIPNVDLDQSEVWGIQLEVGSIKTDAMITVAMGTVRSILRGYVTIEYTKNTDPDGDGMLTMPPGVMTEATAYGCTVTASGTYTTSNDFRALNAFDGNMSSVWASNMTGNKWIQLRMASALREIIVDVYEQSGVVLYPTAGNVQGSNNGTSWTQIGSFSGWSKDNMGSDGLLGSIVCNNTSTAYRYVRLNVTSCIANYQFDIAEIKIRGKQ